MKLSVMFNLRVRRVKSSSLLFIIGVVSQFVIYSVDYQTRPVEYLITDTDIPTGVVHG